MKKLLFALMIFTFTTCLAGCMKGEDSDLTTDVPTPSSQSLTKDINSSTVVDRENIKEEKAPVITGRAGGDTPSGLMPLSPVTYTLEEVEGEPVEKLSHSHGPSQGGVAHHTVIEFQKLFDKYSALTLDALSEEKVLYLTFDCGYEHDGLTGKVLDTLKEKQVPAAFFCTLEHIKAEPEIIGRMIREGHIVGNHSARHPSFAEISQKEMISEIEETENYLRSEFGYTAYYFRFPKGEYSRKALKVVEEMGYTSVFWSAAYDDWDTENIRGKDYAVNKVMSRLHKGAIILLHSVSHDNAQALGEIIDKAREQGYEFRALTDYGK